MSSITGFASQAASIVYNVVSYIPPAVNAVVQTVWDALPQLIPTSPDSQESGSISPGGPPREEQPAPSQDLEQGRAPAAPEPDPLAPAQAQNPPEPRKSCCSRLFSCFSRGSAEKSEVDIELAKPVPASAAHPAPTSTEESRRKELDEVRNSKENAAKARLSEVIRTLFCADKNLELSAVILTKMIPQDAIVDFTTQEVNGKTEFTITLKEEQEAPLSRDGSEALGANMKIRVAQRIEGEIDLENHKITFEGGKISGCLNLMPISSSLKSITYHPETGDCDIELHSSFYRKSFPWSTDYLLEVFGRQEWPKARGNP